ncbi:SH3 domain-containing protein [Hyphomicrobium sp.]|uniref:SH3 domain-containing protein n=1 Tax=Hyphomicrobium sp. TaxID=82 RepID=UPI002BF543DC|nr:SH3 domain-containing protein [Hyphomicrobium sp.]HRN87751.1 SH3 domain-containing protein [Hyphomicrobium sp.]HRQ28351.1 SH3 domain-containing protein [Hyphomicrobium sp.]
MLRPFLILSVVSGTTAAFAGPVPLSGEDLKRSLNGALIAMDTPLGTTIPVRFGTDGLVSGEAGELAPLLGSARDRGRWWIDGDKICSKWFRWFDAEPQCLSVQQDGARLFWQQDNGKKGTATVVEGPPADKAAPEKTIVAKAESIAQPTSPPAKTKSQTKGEATQARVSAPRIQPVPEPLPLPVRAPARAEVTQVAGVDLTPEGALPQAQGEATVVQTASASDAVADVPMMRFGGAGLLAASARIASVEHSQPVSIPVTSAEATKQKPAADMRVAAHSPAPKAKPASGSPPPARETGSLKQPAAKDSLAERDPWTSAPSIHAPGFYRVRGVARRDVLNVRRGPSDGHPAVASIPPNGRRIEVTGACQGEWCPVRYRRATGWVHSFYLSEEAPGRGSASRVYLAQP